MSENNISALVQALASSGQIDLDALVQALVKGTPVVTVPVKGKKVEYTRTDGTVVLCSKRQAKAWSRRQGTPEQQAVTRAKQADFLAKIVAKGQARDTAGLPKKADSRYANRAAAFDARLGMGEWATLRDAYLNGDLMPSAGAHTYASTK